MMHKIADATANWLVKANAINSEDRELYSYAMYSFLFATAPLMLTMVIGIFMNMFLESVLFILPFVIIRKFCGGFHLKSPTVCIFVSTGIIIAFLCAIRFVFNHGIYWPVAITTLLCAVQLFIKSPIDSEARKLSEREVVIFGRIARCFVVVGLIFVLIFALLRNYMVAIPICFGIILSGVLQLPCYFEPKKN